MSQPNLNLNISQQSVTGACNYKCSYTFKYPESSSTATNGGSYISLTYDNGTTPPVLFNSQQYNVGTISISCPSVHLFNNNQTAGELIIEHSPVSGGQPLIVSIPLTSSANSSTSSDLVTQIIQAVINNAPSSGETTNLNISGFTLDNIVPKKPYYNYVDPEKANWIVFDIMNAIPINSSILNSLSQIIQPFPYQFIADISNNDLFYNSHGPNSSGSAVSEGIYISCQPTGSSEEETNVSYNKNQTVYDLQNILNNPTFILVLEIIAACIVFIILIFIVNFLYNTYINYGNKTSPPNTKTS